MEGRGSGSGGRRVTLLGGVIEQIGTPLDVYEKPATPFVADFLGKVNVLHGVCTGEEACAALDSWGNSLSMVSTQSTQKRSSGVRNLRLSLARCSAEMAA